MTPRLHVAPPALGASRIVLDAADSHYVLGVLRLRAGATIELFDGVGGRYRAVLCVDGRRQAALEAIEPLRKTPRSALQLSLAQGIAQAQRMDLVIEKATELGSRRSCRCAPGAARSSSTTPGLNAVTPIGGASRRGLHAMRPGLAARREPALALTQWLDMLPPASTHGWRLLLDPGAPLALSSLDFGASRASARLVVTQGLESGLDDAETATLVAAGFIRVSLGPRVLRTESRGARRGGRIAGTDRRFLIDGVPGGQGSALADDLETRFRGRRPPACFTVAARVMRYPIAAREMCARGPVRANPALARPDTEDERDEHAEFGPGCPLGRPTGR
ncbi:MAG: 16S rRNA (uracil(1498)-N(3))-methyltransferase [Burkholderiaceae bacterium]